MRRRDTYVFRKCGHFVAQIYITLPAEAAATICST
jgi:hypothetical protein